MTRTLSAGASKISGSGLQAQAPTRHAPHFTAWSAFTAIELLVVIVCFVILGFLSPALFRAKAPASRVSCVNNLKQVALAFRVFATDHPGQFPMQVLTNQNGELAFTNVGQVFRYYLVLSNELSTPKILLCPRDTRKPAFSYTNLSDANISYFIGCDAEEALPQALLAGDRNLEANGRVVPPGLFVLTTNLAPGWSKQMHQRAGNVALGDGSVQQTTASRLNQLVVQQEISTNRLMVP